MAGTCSSIPWPSPRAGRRAAIGGAFSLFVLAETWLVPVESWFVDRFGPRIVVMIGGLMVGIRWTINSMAISIPMLYGAALSAGWAQARSMAPVSAMR